MLFGCRHILLGSFIPLFPCVSKYLSGSLDEKLWDNNREETKPMAASISNW